MLSRIFRRRIEVKLGAALALALGLGLLALGSTALGTLDRLVADYRVRVGMSDALNEELRTAITELQSQYLDIPRMLDSDAVSAVAGWARARPGMQERLHEGRDALVARYPGRSQRRDVQKQGQVLIEEHPDGVSVSFGVFTNGAFAEAVRELRITTSDPAPIAAEARTVMAEAGDAGALERRRQMLFSRLADAALEAEAARNALVGRVDEINRKDGQIIGHTEEARRRMLLLSVAVLAATLLALLLVARFIVIRPLRSATGLLRAVIDGAEIEVGQPSRLDEIGDLGRGVVRLQQTLADNRRLTQQQSEEQAARDAERAERERRARAFEAATLSFSEVLRDLTHGLTACSQDMQRTARAMAHTAVETKTRAASVRRAADDAAASSQAVAAASEQLAASTQEIDRQLVLSGRVADAAATDAGRTSDSFGTLTRAAARIDSIRGRIAGVASQTTLLALNASIESARAGEAGRGFAVVASEIRTLAQQTERATGEISDDVQSMQAAMTAARAAVGAIGGTVDEMRQIERTIAAAVEGQGAAVAEIAHSIQAAAAGTSAVSLHIAGVESDAETTERAAEQAVTAAEVLARRIGELQAAVRSYLEAGRAEFAA
ncbi:methyl-accepting chemotaxis protein [Constrictibacter sp. MBR-5]|jgi:methyl-accepting chemotaxis protein|uniref:methyl-accepting chemotaxis protein n=1 Tax=Constrictibacter sp. MBR-5 TaxID=3156467 RepID=UPI003392D029